MESNSENRIRIKAMCLITDGDRVLAGRGYDTVKREEHFRLLGGSVHFGETSEQGVRREIREELHSEIENLELLDSVENIFTYEGEPGHQIVFLFQGILSRKEVYKQEKIHIVEAGYEFDAEWVAVKDILTQKVRLYPEYDYAKVLSNKKEG